MDHKTHVGLVYTHAKGIGGYHHTHLILLPFPLAEVLVIGGESSMIVGGGHSAVGEKMGYSAAIVAGPYVYYGTAFGVLEYVEQFTLLMVGGTHYICEVLPSKTHAENVGLTETQLTLYVFYNVLGGGGGKGEYGRVGLKLAHLGDGKIGWTEVIAPLGYAVGLVDGYKTDVYLGKFVEKQLGGKALWRHIQYLNPTEDGAVEGGDNVVSAHVGGYGGCGYVALAEAGNLVFHKGNKWGDNETHPVHGEGRHLKGYGLPSACGHEAKGVPPVAYAVYNVLLYATKGVVAPIFLKYGTIRLSHLGGYPLSATVSRHA